MLSLLFCAVYLKHYDVGRWENEKREVEGGG